MNFHHVPEGFEYRTSDAKDANRMDDLGRQPRLCHIDSGLVPCDRWVHPFEGAYTRIAKLAIANLMSPAELCPILFNRRLLQSHARRVHGRSLLNTAWVPDTASALGKSLVTASLDAVCNRWNLNIASDHHLRFCQECANSGFQSVVHQIDALAECPLHASPLLEACPRCAAPTPAYAMTAESFQPPMCCPSCLHPYAACWDGGLNFDRWSKPVDTAPFQQIWQRLKSFEQLRVNWPQASAWRLDPSSATPERDQRKAVFATLSRLVGGAPVRAPAESNAREDTRVLMSVFPCAPRLTTPLLLSPDAVPDRIAIYKCIRRRFIRRHRLHRANQKLDLPDTFYVDWGTDALVPKSSECSPELHALALWRHRFEKDFLSDAWARHAHAHMPAWSRSFRLREQMLQWPGDWHVEACGWGEYVAATLAEDHWSAVQWRAQTASLGHPLADHRPQDEDATARRAQYLDCFSTWKARMSAKLQLWPEGVTHLAWERAPGEMCMVVARADGTASLRPYSFQGACA